MLTGQLDEFNNNIINPFHSRSEKVIIQNNTKNVPNFPQTFVKSTMLPVAFSHTIQTCQSQILAQSLSKLKIENVPSSTFEHPNSKFPLTSDETIFYQPKSDLTKNAAQPISGYLRWRNHLLLL